MGWRAFIHLLFPSIRKIRLRAGVKDFPNVMELGRSGMNPTNLGMKTGPGA
jgi:hypothetical protein